MTRIRPIKVRLGKLIAETAGNAGVAAVASTRLRGSAFGTLSAVQAGGNLIASVVAGVLWKTVSPTPAFVYAAALMALSLPLLASAARNA